MHKCTLASSASVFSPLMASNATFALKTGEWFRRGLLLMIISAFSGSWPGFDVAECSTYRGVQISGATSFRSQRSLEWITRNPAFTLDQVEIAVHDDDVSTRLHVAKFVGSGSDIVNVCGLKVHEWQALYAVLGGAVAPIGLIHIEPLPARVDRNFVGVTEPVGSDPGACSVDHDDEAIVAGAAIPGTARPLLRADRDPESTGKVFNDEVRRRQIDAVDLRKPGRYRDIALKAETPP